MPTALFTGLAPSAPLLEASFAPLIALHREGVLQRIVYVTWDDAKYDSHVAPAAAWPEVEIVRIPQPELSGPYYRKSFVYQNRTQAAGLRHIGDTDELVVKLRPDFIFDKSFLAAKIASFETWRAAPDFSSFVKVPTPPSPFAARIWVPWATANLPFYMEDGAFMGLCSDLQKLARPEAETLALQYGTEETVIICHALRFLMPFLDDYPLFERLLRQFHIFRMENGYRSKFLTASLTDPFFWHFLIAQAWITATSYHIDCGGQGSLRLVQTKTAHENAGKPIAEIPDNVLYADVEGWRREQKPGTMMPLLMHLCGRLVDDDWQRAVFSGPVQMGCMPEVLLSVLNNLRLYPTGLLDEMEDTYYEAMDRLYVEHFGALPG